MARPAAKKAAKPARAARKRTRAAASVEAESADDAPLTDKQRRFVEEYLVDLNATQAAIRAGYTPDNADVTGPRMLGNVGIADAIAAAQAERSRRVRVTQDDVLRQFWAIATADPNELIEFRRTCCRWCYGEGHRYQRTQVELDRHRAEWEAMQARAAKSRKDGDPPPAPFDPQGGAGYDARKAPNPACPECFGEGVGQAFAKDTRALSPAARRLYAGVKATKEGLEVRMHDQHAALVNVGKHLGMFTEKHEHTGKDGGPIQTETTVKQSWTVAGREIAWN